LREMQENGREVQTYGGREIIQASTEAHYKSERITRRKGAK